MLIVGLTGSVGMGKSTAVAMLRRLGLPVHDADAAVHRMMAPGGAAVAEIDRAFPGAVKAGVVDRRRLGDLVFAEPAARRRLEAILHPLVRRATGQFLRRQRSRRAPVAVLDVPLLFETGGERLCHAVIVVSAPARVQQSRVMARAGMTAEKFRGILAAQMSDAEKRRRADFVVPTGLGKSLTLRRLRAIVTLLRDGGWRPRPGLRRRPALPRLDRG